MNPYYMNPYMMEEAAAAIVGLLTSVVPSSVLGIASYVLSSMALYTLASRRGIGKAWLSWVPVLNVWILGSLSDQYRYVVKGQYKSKRKSLLILNIVNMVLGLTMAIICIVMVVKLAGGAVYGIREDELIRMAMGPVIAIGGMCLPMAGVAIAAAVIRYMALYDVYTSMDPANSVLFLVLSIIFNVTEPFFLFFSRNKDNGMPPRKQEPQSYIPEPVPDDTWEQNEYL